MTRIDDLLSTGGRSSARTLTVVWLVPVVLAVAATFATATNLLLALPLLLVAMIPWLVMIVGRTLPGWLFGVLGVIPVGILLALGGVNASVFLGTTALSYLASRTVLSWQLAALVAAGIGLPFLSLIAGQGFDPGSFYFAIGDVFGIAVGVLLGYSFRLSARLREADGRLAAARIHAERTRLARDVHDLVAHSLTVVVLHIGGSRRVLRSNPAAAERALEQAETVCRDSLDGIRTTVGLLRADDDPQQAGSDLARLIDTYRNAGIPLTTTIDDEVIHAPLFAQGLLHRVAQETLANAARYRTPGTSVDLTATIADRTLTYTLGNTTGTELHISTGGYGLIGLREQVTGSGGTFTTQHLGERWTVTCTIPLNATPRTVPGVPS